MFGSSCLTGKKKDPIPARDPATRHIRLQRLADGSHLSIVGLRVPGPSDAEREACVGHYAVMVKQLNRPPG